MAFLKVFSKALCLLSSSRSLALESWADLEDRPLLGGGGASAALEAEPLLVWPPVDVEAMIKVKSLGYKMGAGSRIGNKMAARRQRSKMATHKGLCRDCWPRGRLPQNGN